MIFLEGKNLDALSLQVCFADFQTITKQAKVCTADVD